MSDAADRLTSELLIFRIAMAHYHVSPGVEGDGKDACKICGLDLRNPVHATINIERQRKTNSIIAVAIANRTNGP